MKANTDELATIAVAVANELDEKNMLSDSVSLADITSLVARTIGRAAINIEKTYKNDNQCSAIINCCDCVNSEYCKSGSLT